MNMLTRFSTGFSACVAAIQRKWDGPDFSQFDVPDPTPAPMPAQTPTQSDYAQQPVRTQFVVPRSGVSQPRVPQVLKPLSPESLKRPSTYAVNKKAYVEAVVERFDVPANPLDESFRQTRLILANDDGDVFAILLGRIFDEFSKNNWVELLPGTAALRDNYLGSSIMMPCDAVLNALSHVGIVITVDKDNPGKVIVEKNKIDESKIFTSEIINRQIEHVAYYGQDTGSNLSVAHNQVIDALMNHQKIITAIGTNARGELENEDVELAQILTDARANGYDFFHVAGHWYCVKK